MMTINHTEISIVVPWPSLYSEAEKKLATDANFNVFPLSQPRQRQG